MPTATPTATATPVPTPVLVIADVQGAAGTTVTMDVVFSNPMGTGFSGLSMGVIIEDPTIAEFVDVQFPSWIDSFFADILMEIFIAPGGFPTSEVNLVVFDLGIQEIDGVISGVITNEVLATLNLNLLKPGKTRLFLNLPILDDDSGESLIPMTEAPTIVTITVQ